MSTIINPAWKGKKAGIVTYKGEVYEIGSDAFGSVTDAAAEGYTSDLVIVDKKLSSPVTVSGNKEYITGAATDIFMATVKDPDPVGTVTANKTIKFTAAAGGSATIKATDADLLKGFEKVTASEAGGSFQGGKIDISSAYKTTDDTDRGIETLDSSASVNSSATGTLSVTGKGTNIPDVSVGAITDPDSNTDDSFAIIQEAYKGAKGDDDYKDKTGASYASVTLKLAEINSVNGGSYTEKGTHKKYTNDEKKTEEFVYSYAEKAGAGSATLTNSSAKNIVGFKTVKVTASTRDVSVSSLSAGTYSEDYSTKTAYDADKSSSINISAKKAETVSGSLTLSGNATRKVAVDGEINDFSSMTLKYATVSGEIESEVESKKSTIDISVKKQKDENFLTASFSADESEEADGSLTANNSTIKNLEGVKTVTLKNSVINGNVDATNTKIKATKKETGITDDISDDQAADYVSKFGVDYTTSTTPGSLDTLDATLIDKDAAYSFEYSKKSEKSAGGTSFKMSGSIADNSTIGKLNGYKTVSLDNTNNTKTLTATLGNSSKTSDTTYKETFTPEVSYSTTKKETTSNKAFGDAAIKGYTSANVTGFASVKVTGNDNTALTGVTGQNTDSKTTSTSKTIKTGRDGFVGTSSETETSSSKIASTLDAQKAKLSGNFKNLKTVKLTNVTSTADVTFSNALADGSSSENENKTSTSVTWNAENLDATEKTPTNFWDEKVTSWTETSENKKTTVGSFTFKNTTANWGTNKLNVKNFKTATLTFANATDAVSGSLANAADTTEKKSIKRTVTETKRTQDIKNESKKSSTGSLTIKGKSTAADTNTTFTATGNIGYSSITLTDAKIAGTVNASAYTETENYTATESATLDSGTAATVTLKVSTTHNTTGNGSFSATASYAMTAFAGTLNGYNTISLTKGGISIGNANNYKYVGGDANGVYDSYAVMANGSEYFDVIAKKGGDTSIIPESAENLAGNITGSYTLDTKGVSSSWKATKAKVSAGSFTQTGKSDAFVTAGTITGYDKVKLEYSNLSTNSIVGSNQEVVTQLTYKSANDEDIVNTKVETTSYTSASSVSMSGKKKDTSAATLATVTNITDYKTVTLTAVNVKGTVTAKDKAEVKTTDKLDGTVVTTETTEKAIGSLIAKESKFSATSAMDVSGFQKVELEDTEASANISFTGGSSNKVVNDKPFTLFEEKAAAGSFTAKATMPSTSDANLKAKQTVGDITGFQKVALTEYNAGDVKVAFTGSNANATYFKHTPADDEKETPETWSEAAATKNNTFSATAAGYYDKATSSFKSNAITVSDVIGYGKVEATGLASIGKIENASITDVLPGTFSGRLYANKHYGNWTSTAKETATKYSKIDVDAGTKAKVVGLTDDNGSGTPVYARTAVKGDILGYSAIELDTVTIGDTTSASYKFAGGKYEYSTKTDRDDNVIATSTSSAVGSLKISNAQIGTGTTGFEVEGFQTVNADFTAETTTAVKFTKIIGGTEEAKFVGATLDSTSYKFSDDTKLTLKFDSSTAGTIGSAKNLAVAGFAEMKFTDANLAGDIQGYTVASNTWTAKSEITFDNNNSTTANTVSGDILYAKRIVFKSSTADTTDDFTVSGNIKSKAKAATTTTPGVAAESLTIEIDKSQVSMDMSKFELDNNDVINLITGAAPGETATVNIALGTSNLATYFTNMTGATFTGAGTLAFSGGGYGTEDAFKSAWSTYTSSTSTTPHVNVDGTFTVTWKAS